MTVAGTRQRAGGATSAESGRKRNGPGETRIERTFATLRRRGQKGLIAYIMAGDPSLQDTFEIALGLEEAGVDILELGVPFSDPLADGRVNQDAAARALASGTTLERVLELVVRVRASSDLPIVLFSYFNPLFACGLNLAVRRSAAAGVDGVLVVDLPPEEAGDFGEALRAYRLNHICLVAPTTPERRIARVVKDASGFVYCVSREGVTGMRERLAAGARELVLRTRRFTSLPIAMGFGVSTPEHAREAAEFADAVVVGSAIVDRFHRAGRTRRARKEVLAWVRKLVLAAKGKIHA